MARRLLFGLIALFLNGHPYFQIILMMGMSLFVLIYLVEVKPYKESQANYIEIFNESCVLIQLTMQLALLRDDFTIESYSYSAGWAVLGVTAICFFVNIGFILVKTVRNFYLRALPKIR